MLLLALAALQELIRQCMASITVLLAQSANQLLLRVLIPALHVLHCVLLERTGACFLAIQGQILVIPVPQGSSQPPMALFIVISVLLLRTLLAIQRPVLCVRQAVFLVVLALALDLLPAPHCVYRALSAL